MEIEDLLKDAAGWRPKTEMPEGLESRGLSRVRPPLRPMGIARPRTALLATTMAGAACLFLMIRIPREMPKPLTAPTVSSATPAPKEPVAPKQTVTTPKRREETPATERKTVRRKTARHSKPKVAQRRPLRELPPKREIESPLTKPFAVAVDSIGDNVMVGSRVAVDPPVFIPAYHAEPSADGQEITYTPVVVPMNDPGLTSTAID